MSGICGIVHLNGRPVLPSALEPMMRAAIHRGPDGTRTWNDGEVAFGHLDHRILPESHIAEQPLTSADSRYVLVAHARIDNRNELIRSLRGEKHEAADLDAVPSDARLILLAYRKWGSECAEHLIGDFAFAVWDAAERRLFAARDPMSIHPFYYRIEPHRFLFASEIKQILANPEVPVRLFEPAVAAHLAGPYGLPDWTFYEGISQLSPGFALTVDEGGHRTWRFWDIDPAKTITYRRDEEYVEHFREVFRSAVESRLRCANPVGISLSGGMDSGSMAAMAGWLSRSTGGSFPEIRTFSWAFDELTECDERGVSRHIVELYGLTATDVWGDDSWPLCGYPRFGPDRDEPYLQVYQSLIERTLEAARAEGIGVMMSGERGDNVVGNAVFDLAGLLRSRRYKALFREIGALSQETGASWPRIVRRRLLPQIAGSLAVRRPRSTFPGTPPWIRPEVVDKYEVREIIELEHPRVPFRDEARRLRYEMIFSTAVRRWLVDAERVCARFGLGFADPWSDRRLAEFVLAIPQWQVHRPACYKSLVRRAMRGIMPEPARQTAGKTIPASLYDRGLKEQAQPVIRALMQEPRSEILGFLNARELQNVYDDFLAGRATRHDFWWPLTLEIWLRKYWI